MSKINHSHEQNLTRRVHCLESMLKRDKSYFQRKFIGVKRRERLARKISRHTEQLAAVKMELALIT